MRILIVDEHAVVRLGLRQLLRSRTRETGEAATGAAALEMIRNSLWDLVLLGLRLPDMEDLEILVRIKCLAPGLPVIVLSHEAAKIEEQFRRTDTDAYLPKVSPPRDILEAVDRLAGSSGSPAERTRAPSTAPASNAIRRRILWLPEL